MAQLNEPTWVLPGSVLRRRAILYGVAARVARRYALAWLGARVGRPADPQSLHARGANDLRAAATTLRGGFLKLGQFASARPDLLPEAYVEQLSTLQDRVPPAPESVTRTVIEQDVGPVDGLFAEFDAAASAASLAQVHRARRNDGRAVAVKVQYPDVARIVPREAADSRRIMKLVARVVSGIDLPTIADALERVIVSELDYVQEAANIDRFAGNFAGEPAVVVPAPHRDISGGRVLVMDWVEGENLARALHTAEPAVAQEAVRILVDSYLKQILVDGFLHADPHPGNFLLQDGPRLGFVDFGACDAISEPTRLAMRALYAAGMRNDIPKAVEALDALGFRTKTGDLAGLVEWAGLFTFDTPAQDREASWARLNAAARDNPLVKIPDELIMIGRVLIVQTGLVARIKPSWRLDDLVEARLSSPA